MQLPQLGSWTSVFRPGMRNGHWTSLLIPIGLRGRATFVIWVWKGQGPVTYNNGGWSFIITGHLSCPGASTPLCQVCTGHGCDIPRDTNTLLPLKRPEGVALPKGKVEVPDGANTKLKLILGILRDKCAMPQMPRPIKVSAPEAEL